MKEKCTNETLAQRGIGTVDICQQCQIVHVNIDAVSMRFKPEGFREFCRLMAMALHRLQSQPRPESGAVSSMKDGLH